MLNHGDRVIFKDFRDSMEHCATVFQFKDGYVWVVRDDGVSGRSDGMWLCTPSHVRDMPTPDDYAPSFNAEAHRSFIRNLGG